MNLLLIINKGRNKRANFVIFLVWYTLIVGGMVSVGVLVAWSIKSCLGPAEIASFVSLVLFKNAGRKLSARFHLFVSDVDQGNKTFTRRSFYLNCPPEILNTISYDKNSSHYHDSHVQKIKSNI